MQLNLLVEDGGEDGVQLLDVVRLQVGGQLAEELLEEGHVVGRAGVVGELAVERLAEDLKVSARGQLNAAQRGGVHAVGVHAKGLLRQTEVGLLLQALALQLVRQQLLFRARSAHLQVLLQQLVLQRLLLLLLRPGLFRFSGGGLLLVGISGRAGLADWLLIVVVPVLLYVAVLLVVPLVCRQGGLGYYCLEKVGEGRIKT